MTGRYLHSLQGLHIHTPNSNDCSSSMQNPQTPFLFLGCDLGPSNLPVSGGQWLVSARYALHECTHEHATHKITLKILRTHSRDYSVRTWIVTQSGVVPVRVLQVCIPPLMHAYAHTETNRTYTAKTFLCIIETRYPSFTGTFELGICCQTVFGNQ